MSEEEDQSGASKVKKLRMDKISNVATEVLIGEVEKRPCLWNERHGDYKNPSTSKMLWDEIGDAVNITGDEAKKKWKNLKDTYRRLIQKSHKSASAALREKKWKYADCMRFTRDQMLHIPVIGDVSNPTPPIEDEEMQNLEPDALWLQSIVVTPHDTCTTSATVAGVKSTTVTPQDHTSSAPVVGLKSTTITPQDRTTSAPIGLKSTTITPNVRKKRAPVVEKRRYRPYISNAFSLAKKDMKQRMVDLEERKIEAILSMKGQNERTDEGDDYHFLISLLPFIKPLSPMAKLELRSRLQLDVMEAYRVYEGERNAFHLGRGASTPSIDERSGSSSRISPFSEDQAEDLY